MRLSKRELAASIIMYKKFGEGEANLEDLVSLLREEMCLTRRSAMNVIKRLRKLGFLEVRAGGRSIAAILRNPLEPLEAMASSYVSSRKGRCRRPI
ncbi:MAG: BlaI/MecI/CopY family transcriptional regulator [Acidilobaceae archaeon]|nr:BlaI/MecI/CopY family transcriptional regulator [Acidilobaceae archaeon]